MRRLTPVKLAAIYKRVAGPRVGLLLPIDSQDRRILGAEFIVPPTYTDVTGLPSSAADLFKDLQAADSIDTVCRLASSARLRMCRTSRQAERIPA